jgi:gas vesicle protein
MTSGKVLLGILAGAVAGAAIGVLFASESGTETRKKIAKGAGDYFAGLKNRLTEWAENSLLQLDGAKGTSPDLSSSNASKIEDAQTA